MGLVFVLLFGNESIEAVRTFSASDGRCTIPLIGPPTIELGLAGLALPLLVSTAAISSACCNPTGTSTVFDDRGYQMTGDRVVEDEHECSSRFARFLDFPMVLMTSSPQDLFVRGSNGPLSCVGAL